MDRWNLNLGILGLVFLFLGACSPYPDLRNLKSESENPEMLSQKAAKILLEGPVGSYSVNLEWSLEAQTYDSIVVERMDVSKSDKRVLASLPGVYESFKDTRVPHDSAYEYWVLGLTRNRLVMLAQFRVEVPKDILVDRELRLHQDLTGSFGRLVLLEDAKIVTDGYAIDIQVDRLFAAKGSRIVSFDPLLPSLSGVGKSSGAIRVQSQTAEGSLRIESFGQQGAQGPRGLDAVGRGARGLDSEGRCQMMGGERECYCHREATPGARGPRGGVGGPGFRGGDVSPVSISILDPQSRFLVSLDQRVGLGGVGGRGGRGGAGGEPGTGGRGSCQAQERQGDPGEEGALGPSGVAGQIHASCVKIGLSSIGSCH